LRNLFLKNVPTLIGLLFLFTGAMKLFNPGQATMALESLDVSYGLAKLLVASVTILELYLGVILLRRLDLKYAMGLSMALMFLFTVYMWYLSTMASPPSCGCLGMTGVFTSNKHAALFGVFQNCVILWMLKWSYDYHFREIPVVAEAKPA